MSIHYFDNNTTLKSTSEQDDFILSNKNFIILNSCAGSGKTRCLVLKIKHLMDKFKIKPSDLIICTYTKVMTYALKSRIKYHFDNLLNKALIGTFHSICYQLIKPIMFENEENFNLSNEVASPEEILVYAYENIINNNIDLSSKYLIIDEYQDLSPMQQKIIYHLLSFGKIKGVFLIGDYNQSIYNFLANQRLDQAYQGLLETDIPMKILAHKIGYSHVNHFITAFKNKFGVTPGSIRRQIK
jgi:superfamily I DNA/RNA helicase